MKKIASMTLDVVDYMINDELDKLAQVVEGLSVQAKTSHIPSYEEQSARADKDFALILWEPALGKLHKYAKYTPELTELNLAFLAENLEKLPEEVIKIAAANLTFAAKNQKIIIPETLQKYASDKYIPNLIDLREVNELSYIQKQASMEKTASASIFALPELQKFPLETEGQVKKASAYFEKNHGKLDLYEKYQFALNVKTAADTQGVPLDKTEVLKYASLKPEMFNEDFYYNIQTRKSYLKDDETEARESFDTLLARADELGTIKVAEVMYELDKALGLTGTYGNGLNDPLLSTLGTEKVAGVEIDGILVGKEKLANLNSQTLTAIVGNDVIKELKGENGIEVLASLPRPVRKDILELL